MLALELELGQEEAEASRGCSACGAEASGLSEQRGERKTLFKQHFGGGEGGSEEVFLCQECDEELDRLVGQMKRFKERMAARKKPTQEALAASSSSSTACDVCGLRSSELKVLGGRMATVVSPTKAGKKVLEMHVCLFLYLFSKGAVLK